MALLRIALERMLLLGFAAARSLLLLQALSFAVALVSVLGFWTTAADWLRSALLSGLGAAATLGVAGVLLAVARRRFVPRAASATSSAGAADWPRALALSLLGIATLAAWGAADLVPLWREIGARLAQIGFGQWLAQPGGAGSILTIAILCALFVPALISAAALACAVLPLLLLPSLAARSRLFPTLLAMSATCQAGLALAGAIAAGALSTLAGQALAAMAASGDAEVLGLMDPLRGALEVLIATPRLLALPLLSMLAWVWFLRPSGDAAAYFAGGGEAAPREPRPEPVRAERRPHAPRGKTALVVIGAFMLCFALFDAARTRARFAASEPAPGATLAAPPVVVRVRFTAALDPASTLSLTRLGGVASAVVGPSRVAPDDPARRTLEAPAADLGPGVYHVAWHALPAGGGVSRHGSFRFGVGAALPADDAADTHALQERDSGARGRRHTFAGGAILLALAALLPRPPSRGR